MFAFYLKTRMFLEINFKKGLGFNHIPEIFE